jgi:hypothetical protein
VYDGTNKSVYCDGTRLSTTAASLNVTDSTDIKIGSHIADSRYNFDGYIDELRVSDVARYTGTSYSVPTTTFVNDDDTILLLHMDGSNGSQFFDDDNGDFGTNRTAKEVTAVGGAEIDTAQSKFGGSSFLPNTGYLTVSDSDDFIIGDNYTIECWLYATTVDTNYRNFYSINDGGANYLSLAYQSTVGWAVEWRYSGGNHSFTRTGSSPLTTWRHFAFVKNGTNGYIFVDGVQMGATLTSLNNSINFTNDLRIGQFSLSANGWIGNIDELRVSNKARYTAAFTPSTTSFINDSNTKLLLHMDGADGSTTFTDDNTTGRSAVGVKAIGNAQIDTAQSKFGGASALFDGTGDYLQFPNNIITALDDFTVEAWIRLDIIPPSNNNWQMLLGNAGSGGNAIYMAIKNRSGTIVSDIVLSNGSGSFIEEEYTIPSISANTWYHWAICKSGGTLKHFFNGTELTTLLASSGTMTSAFGLHIASLIGTWSAGTWSWDGYIDEFRISNKARYTASFTAPTAPFVNDANTLLLLHMDGTDARTLFLDDNGAEGRGTALAVIPINNAQVDTAQSKFGGSSLLLDGADDYLEIETVGNFGFGTDDFTCECWIYPTSTSGDRAIFEFRDTGTTTNFVVFVSGGNLGMFAGGATRIISTGAPVSASTWQHIALSRSSGSTKLFLDGTQVGSSYSDSTSYADERLRIGADYTSAADFIGNIDEVRISNAARYTSGFTPSTQPFTNDANTLMLLHMDGADGSTTFLDDCGRQKVGVTALGNAQIDTAQYKFGGSSLAIDGTADYLKIASSDTFNFGTDNFTVEFWVRPTSIPGDRYVIGSSTGSFGSGSLGLGTAGSGTAVLRFYVNDSGGDIVADSSTMSLNTWYHYALVRSGTTFTLYRDGTSVDTGTYAGSINFSNTGGLIIGQAAWVLTGSYGLPGHIDELRISNTARYTTTFTPDTTPFQNDANTVLLLHMDGTDASTDFVDDNGKESA